MNNNCIEWSKVKSIVAVCDTMDRDLYLEYKGFNTLYSPEMKREFWFNNALTPFVYEGLCIFICTDNSTSILDKYDVVEITLKEEI